MITFNKDLLRLRICQIVPNHEALHNKELHINILPKLKEEGWPGEASGPLETSTLYHYCYKLRVKRKLYEKSLEELKKVKTRITPDMTYPLGLKF